MKGLSLRFMILIYYLITLNYGEEAIKPKNTLLLLADDGGFEIGAYLNPFCQTPNLDALAKKSIIFNNAFTSVSSCSPSRSQLLTGQPSHQTGMYGLHQGVHHFNVFETVTSLPNLLKSRDIFTGIIGKKHVGPNANFKFDFEETEETHCINQIGRNITNMKLFVRKFLDIVSTKNKPFFLMIGFHDPHRCGHITPQYGEFCERWGSGEQDMGTISDWKPINYDWRNINVPSYLPDTEEVKKELAAQYMTISRLDQGVGLILNELRNFLVDNDTLIIYTSDNGPPFPGGRTNLYDPGIREPMFLYSPLPKVRRNSVTNSMTSLLDIFPTILDTFNIQLNETIKITGKSLLPLLISEPIPKNTDAIFGSQNYHEITMNYPMRMIRTRRYKLVHNLNYQSYFPIDQDLYTSGTFQLILNRTLSKEQIPWMKTLYKYYIRPEWELFDLKMDPLEQWNLADKQNFQEIKIGMQKQLKSWQIKTNDPWQCAPHGVLEDTGYFKEKPSCLSLGHESFGKL